MKRSLLFAIGLLGAALAPRAAADVEVRITNQLPGPLSIPGSTPGQFGSAAMTTGGLDSRPASSIPVSGTNRLRRVTMGPSFGAGAPDYGFGDVVQPPAPSALGAWRERPLRPDEVVRVGGADVIPVPAGTVLHYYYSIHSEQVYAAEPGIVEVHWRSDLPDAATGNYIVEKRTYVVSYIPSVPPLPALPVEPNRIFWTEAPYEGPTVNLPSNVQDVYIHYRSEFPATAGAPAAGETRTFFLDELSGIRTLRARAVSGRIFVEILGETTDGATGARVPLGTRLVDVLEDTTPGSTSFTVTTSLGEKLEPSNGDAALVPNENPVGVTASPPFIRNRPVNSQTAYFAERTTQTNGDVILFWKKPDSLGISWPYFRNTYTLVWPTDGAAYALNALDGTDTMTPVNVFGAQTPTLVFQDDPDEARLEGGIFTVSPGAEGTNRALLLMQVDGHFWYVRVFSATQDKFLSGAGGQQTVAGLAVPAMVSYSGTAFVGERLTPPVLPPEDRMGALSRAGHIVVSLGNAYNPRAYVDPQGPAGFAAAELRSEIIPVNALAGNDTLRVKWFRRMEAPSADFQSLYWPAVVATYTLQWPAESTDANDELVMARNNGTGGQLFNLANTSLYAQNNSALPGYNPNEEHALLIAGEAYALRDDLNLSTSSLPAVLVDYTAPDGRPAMRTFRVQREKQDAIHNYRFDYTVDAGVILQAPSPLPVLPPPLDSQGALLNVELPGSNDDAGEATPDYYDRFTYEDRKHSLWIYRGPHGVSPGSFTMRYYYVVQPGFDFPGVANPPAPGTTQPYLRAGTPGNYSDTPQDVVFRPQWPDAPVLQFGQTLAKAQFGLPGIRGQTSVQVLYEQSRAAAIAGDVTSVAVLDPTRHKTYAMGSGSLAALPASIATDSRSGKVYFQNLPPHLKERCYFNPFLGQSGALVLEGRFVDSVVGEDYLLLNVLSGDDLAAVKDLVPGTDAVNRSAWESAVDALSTTVETMVPSSTVPGTYEPDSAQNVTYTAGEPAVITDDDQPVDSYALTPAGSGAGYASIITGNAGTHATPEGEPVSVYIIRVGAPNSRGQLLPIESANPLDEKLTLRLTNDFAGRPQDYDFEWRYAPPVNGRVASLDSQSDNPGSAWISLTAPGLSNTWVVQGASVQTLSDNYWIVRYKPKSASHPGANTWSEWTQPALAEGWIKRALRGINPFNQRITDFFNNAVNTDVSILTQAGARWEGDVALNLSNINDFGLLEIYETILNRGIGLSISGAPPQDYGPANDALLLASGYISDLYSIVGDDAAADAANPTIAFDAQAIGSVADSTIAVDFSQVFSQTSTARFAFQGQVASLMDEELALLRGRDDIDSPGVELAPAYNRMYWNYTRGINAGEVIYGLNYNIRERQEASADGRIDAADAQRMFPQGHGDAYGHYLSAITPYYRLMTNNSFTWAPRIEAVNVLGVPVQVDYLDERKFASAASRIAKTAKQIVSLVHRQAQTSDRSHGWRHLRDGDDPSVNYRDGKVTSAKRTRHWGLDEWAARGTQGALYNWVVANSILPADDSQHTGIQKIDRTTVPELDDLALTADEIQKSADKANAWLNPLGLSADSMLFDINPAELAAGKTHFEQIYERATAALGNAFSTFDQATASSRLLRSLENQADDLSAAVYDQERAFNLQLIELYGTPYAGDMGPGKVYASGYEGPDLFRWFYIDRTTVFSDPFNGGEAFETSYRATVDTYNAREYYPEVPDELHYTEFGSPDHLIQDVPYTMNPDSEVQYASGEMGRRQRPGRIQLALQDLNAKREDLVAILDFYNRNEEIFRQALDALDESVTAYSNRQDISTATRDDIQELQETIAGLRHSSRSASFAKDLGQGIAETLSDGFAKVTGVDNDLTFAGRLAVRAAYVAGLVITGSISLAKDNQADHTEVDVAYAENDLERQLEEAGFPPEYLRMAAEVQAAYYDWLALGSNIDQTIIKLQRSRMEYHALLAEGDTIQRSREIFRKRAAAITQGYRTRDVAFRTFRTESLEQYQTLLDWATRYAWLAAKAYDYETGLLGTENGQDFMDRIIATRALGLRNAAGQPVFGASSTGDPGIAGLLAKLHSDWSSVHTRLGFNNPDTYGTVFSLREELFRVPRDTPSAADDADVNDDSQADKTWKEKLQSLLVEDIRTDADVALHCLQAGASSAPTPGIIIPFSSTITDGLNFFGLPLAAGDKAFSASSFATKIHSTGIVLDGYIGLDAYATGSPTAGGPASSAPNALSGTPYVYLIPAGQDIMRTPPLGDGSDLRGFDVQDFALPLPFNIGDNRFSDVDFWTGNSSLSENFLTPRKHQAFRAVDHPFYFFSPLTSDFTNRRLVGRSVWNSGWKLVIPMNTLLNDPYEAQRRFLRSIRDVKLYLRTYSYSGN
jgi:hypothetical protein